MRPPHSGQCLCSGRGKGHRAHRGEVRRASVALWMARCRLPDLPWVPLPCPEFLMLEVQPLCTSAEGISETEFWVMWGEE